MELVDKKIDRYEVIEGNTDPPWHKKYRKIVWIVIAMVGIAILTTIIVISLKCQNCNSIPTAPTTTQILTDSPSLHWEEECSSEVSVCPASFQDNPPLLLVSLDGLRVDYLKYGVSPTLSKIAECGVKAEFMYPIYPSKTFPNHYTIVTGLYPESHGVIDNQMYDLAMNKRFKVGKTRLDDPRWWQKEPIWVTAQKQGKSAACFFWPGSDVRINGSYPNFYFNYNGSIPFETRVDQILEWLMLPKRPDFLTLYFDQPDKAGHAHGPDSFEVKEGIKTVDGLMNRLLTGLEIRNLTNCVNIIIVSDHGMSDTSCDRIFDIRKYINISTADVYTGSFGRIRPKEDSNTVDEIISQLQCQDSHLRVYRKEELPVRMHYVDNERIEPIIVDIDQRYQLVNQDVKQGDWKCNGGNHGYDNISPDMKAIFFAYGPSFKKNITARPFLNIELYELMSEIMNIIPQPNNGTKGSLHGILKRPRNLMPNLTSPPPPVAQVPDLLSVVDFSNCSCNESHYEMFDDGMIKKKNTIHLPFGVPQAAQRNDSLLLLYNNEYILAYDTEKEIPRWASFTITHSKIPYKNSTVCWSGDARVPNATCSSMPDGFITRPLFSPDFSDDKSQSQVFFVTNSILKSKNHTKMFEDEVNNLIEKKLFELGPINIMVGPVFDHHTEDIRRNLTSHLIDSDPIPSHVFVILTWCSSLVEHLGKCDPELLDVQSFLLPNFPFPRNCENAKNAMKKNGARIKEIERITGLTFYSNLSLLDAIRLKTSVDHLGL